MSNQFKCEDCGSVWSGSDLEKFDDATPDTKSGKCPDCGGLASVMAGSW